MNSIFGGLTCQSLKCKNSKCGNINMKKEKIYYISLDIKNCNNLNDCLNKYISEENIEDYKCDKCNTKITHVKNILLEHLPNILIIHLQRITFNYETFLNEKINSRVAFRKKINMKNYTVDRNKVNNNDKKNMEKYEYNLIGVVVHSGTAQFGHYYSFINTKNKDENGPWFKFNDKNVNEYIIPDFEYDMFGGNKNQNSVSEDYGASAFMKIKEKKVKNVVLIDIVNNVFSDIKNEDIKNEENKKEDIKNEDVKNEDVKNEENNNVENKNEENKNEENKNEDNKNEDKKNEENKKEDNKKEEKIKEEKKIEKNKKENKKKENINEENKKEEKENEENKIEKNQTLENKKEEKNNFFENIENNQKKKEREKLVIKNQEKEKKNSPI